MGSRGPVPKRSEQRRRRNSPAPAKAKAGPLEGVRPKELASTHSKKELLAEASKAGLEVGARWTKLEIAEALLSVGVDPGWHPIAREWFEALGVSGQAQFYEPSDWATARLIAESMSRDLKPQVLGVTAEGEPIAFRKPLGGSSLSAYLKGFSALLVTEADRRRVQLELERPTVPGKPAGADAVTLLDAYRDRTG